MRKILIALVTTILMMSSFAMSAFAESGNISTDNKKGYSVPFTRNQFKQWQKEGAISKEVTYEDLIKANQEFDSLSQELDSSPAFNKVYDTSSKALSATKSNGWPALASGDIIITNGTSSAGLTGHAAIAIGSDSILSIEGKGKSINLRTKSSFYKKYKTSSSRWIKVYRPKTASWGTKAGAWAKKNYPKGSSSYQINFDIKGTKKTYCSKIVFQSYKYGVGKKAFNTYFHENSGTSYSYYNQSGIITPYSLSTYIKTNQRGKL